MSKSDEEWAAESARAIDDHNPEREPYASMTRDEIAELMKDDSLGAYEFERLNQHLLDKCSKAELTRINFTNELAAWLIERRDTFGNDQAKLCVDVAVEAAGRLFGEMPAPGPLHEIN